METTLSVKNFQDIVREQIRRVAGEMGWNEDSNTERGYAFQLWVARVVTDFETTLDTGPEDAMLYSRDLGTDLFLEDTASSHLVLCQCKYQAFGKDVIESEANDFFHRHELYLDRSWIRQHGSQAAATILEDYSDRLEAGYTASYYFVSTGKASERVRNLAEKATEEYAARGLGISCEVMDFSGLKDYYVRSLSLEASIPSKVRLDLPKGQFFLKENPYPTLVAVIKGNTLRNLVKQFKQSLFAFNIRGYLGNRGINQDISNTAASDPEHFFYFNNGVSAICTKLELTDNHLTADNFQIINGAQTVSSLARQSPSVELEVLFRLTQTANVKTEKGVNRKIIQFNNSQNSVKLSDFRSNDEIQVFLERRFPELRPKGPLPKLFYLRKRAVGRRGVGYGVRLEEFAKVRYAFLAEPTLVHSSPKALWTPRDEGGVYERAFGVDGELLPAWSDETLDEGLLALIIYRRIDDTSKELAQRSPENRFLRRLRFHGVSLGGQYFRALFRTSDQHRITRNEAPFEDFWTNFWPLAREILINGFHDAMDQDVTMFAFVRSEERWKRMERRMRAHLAAR